MTRQTSNNIPEAQSTEELQEKKLPQRRKTLKDRFNTTTGVLSICASIFIAGATGGYKYCEIEKKNEHNIEILRLNIQHQRALDEVYKESKKKGIEPLTDEEYKFFYDNYIKGKYDKK